MALRTLNLPSGRSKKRLWWSRWIVVSKSWKAMRTHFLLTGHRKKRLGRCSLSDFFKLVYGPENSICSLDFLQNNVSMCRQAKRSYFPHPEHQKNRLRWSLWIDDLSWRMVLRTHNLPSERLKMRLLWCWWSDVSWRRKSIRTHSGRSKSEFFEVPKVMIFVGEWPWDLIICLLNKHLWWSMKLCLKFSKGHAKSFSVTCASRKSSWTTLLKWGFKYSNCIENS
jgi:hypothetical protein